MNFYKSKKFLKASSLDKIYGFLDWNFKNVETIANLDFDSIKSSILQHFGCNFEELIQKFLQLLDGACKKMKTSEMNSNLDDEEFGDFINTGRNAVVCLNKLNALNLRIGQICSDKSLKSTIRKNLFKKVNHDALFKSLDNILFLISKKDSDKILKENSIIYSELVFSHE